VYIVCCAGLASYRWRPLSSNVRPHVANSSQLLQIHGTARGARYCCGRGFGKVWRLRQRSLHVQAPGRANTQAGRLRASLREALRCCVPRGGGVPPPLRYLPRRGCPVAHGQNARRARAAQRERPNPSVKRSANGGPPGPRGFQVHFPPRGPGVPPSSPAYLER
jgi:hypothetical protein